ncbi:MULTISPECIES: porin [unclassified Paraburkholderia]|uniref:porin n=1 Tax=unclassified Paraburkholderia TaxID=2615204 RepID=UPI00160BFF62|nr:MULTISPECIES: porin [unclassified Paraburkholderia]MBB5443719.1 outer membrane protein OmpU [Paraburkholderia sp. WSM4177]MBB5485154.1 outer membrane protein OmpU [Paraburkholderia sp. WSM4180]
MKKYLTGTVMLVAMSGAHAQSSVTLYGLIDAGFTYISNQGGGRLYKFQDGANFGNRFGFKGSEDLGGGLKAIFTLENGFSLGTGQLRNNGALFGRQAFVGIASPYGTVTMGNQYDFIADYITPFNLNGYASVYAGHMGDIDRISGVQLPNSVKYQSPTYRGFSFGGMWSFGNVAGNFKQNSAWSVGAGYKDGGLSAAAIYERLYDVDIYPYAQFGVFNFLGQTVATRNSDGSVTDLFYSSPFIVDRQSEFGVGASYTLNRLTLSANFTSTHLQSTTGSATMNVYEAGAMYFVRPDIALIGGYQYTTWDHTHWHQPTLGAQYYLSKRTNFYVNVSYLHAQPGVDANQGAGFYSLPPNSNTQLTSRIALIHQF